MKKETKEVMKEKEAYKARILGELINHIGEFNAIGMAELYELVFGKAWQNRINDTRRIRNLITELRNEGKPICSVSSQGAGGYYLAAVGSELNDYVRRNERRALKILKRLATVKRTNLPNYLGQLMLNMGGDNETTS